MVHTESIKQMAEDMVTMNDPAIALAEVCVQTYATLRQVKPKVADETMNSIGGARNPFVSMLRTVAQVTDNNHARAALCLVMTKKGLHNPHANDLKVVAKKLDMSPYAGLATACVVYPREEFADTVKRISNLLKQAKIKMPDMVEKSGFPRNTIYAWSTSSRTPRTVKQERYCDAAAQLLHAKAVKR